MDKEFAADFPSHTLVAIPLRKLSHGASVLIMPKDQQKSQPRQRPVSCSFCRTRKLRCSRETPCSNCVSRGVRCDLEKPTIHPSSTTSDLDVLGRLQRVERLLAARDSEQQARTQIPNGQKSSSQPALSSASSPSPQVRCLNNDVALLESIYTDQNDSVSKSFQYRKISIAFAHEISRDACLYQH